MIKINLIKNITIKYIFFIFINNFNVNIELIFNLIKNKKIRGFLNVIAICEGTKKSTRLPNQYPSLKEYKISFMNSEEINNLVDYPNKLFCGNLRRGRGYACASASGRYQFIKSTWNHLSKKIKPELLYEEYKYLFENFFLNLDQIYSKDIIDFYKEPRDLIIYRFGPFWQDFYAILLLLKSNAIKEILNNNYTELIKKASKTWSTFPKDSSGLSFYESRINHAQNLKYTVNLCKKYIPLK